MTVAARDPKRIAWFEEKFRLITSNIELVIQGKDDVVALIVACLLGEGHALLEDVPGVGKTLLAKSLARSIDCTFKRIQFTPDLLPSDVTGVSVWNRDRGSFEFKPGSVFANIVVGDEINRAGHKTQASLLEAMEERQVTVDGVTRALPPPFMVLATQNPLEHEGTYPLPKSQLDRFMMRLMMGYPDRGHSLEILDKHGIKSAFDDLQPVVTAEDIRRMTDIARGIHVAPSIKEYIVDLVEGTRRHADVLLGASPRSTLFLQRLARVVAAIEGREYVTPDDVQRLTAPVLAHRMALRPEAHMRGTAMETVLDNVVRHLRVPGGTGTTA